jgi:hypothetical protein
MTLLMRTRVALAILLISVGIAFACLPDTWIEMWFGIDPDGGNGWIEALLATGPLALGVGIGLEVFLRYRRKLRERSAEASLSGSRSH